VVRVDQPCDGGVSPNRKIPLVSVEIRAFWPAAATFDEVMMAVTQAVGKTVIAAQQEGLAAPPDWVDGP
jgi:hypothetical protein